MCSCTLGVLGFSHVLSQNFYLKWFSEADRYIKLWENEKILFPIFCPLCTYLCIEIWSIDTILAYKKVPRQKTD